MLPTADPSALVTCVMCGAQVPSAAADLVGQGDRCAACTHRAELYRMRGATISQRTSRAASAGDLATGGRTATLVGGLLFVTAALLLAIARDPTLTALGALLGIAGAVVLVVGAFSRAEASLRARIRIRERRASRSWRRQQA